MYGYRAELFKHVVDMTKSMLILQWNKFQVIAHGTFIIPGRYDQENIDRAMDLIPSYRAWNFLKCLRCDQ